MSSAPCCARPRSSSPPGARPGNGTACSPKPTFATPCTISIPWEELFPAEQARLVRLLVRRVEVHPDGLRLHLRVDGLRSLVAELKAEQPQRRAA